MSGYPRVIDLVDAAVRVVKRYRPELLATSIIDLNAEPDGEN
jgi:hypothetical protein